MRPQGDALERPDSLWEWQSNFNSKHLNKEVFQFPMGMAKGYWKNVFSVLHRVSIPYGNGKRGTVLVKKWSATFQFPMGMAKDEFTNIANGRYSFNSLWEWQKGINETYTEIQNKFQFPMGMAKVVHDREAKPMDAIVSIPYGNGKSV